MIKVSKKAKDKQRQLYMVCVIVWPLKDFFVSFFSFLIGGIVEDKDLHLKISKSLVSFQDFFQNFKMCQIPSTIGLE